MLVRVSTFMWGILIGKKEEKTIKMCEFRLQHDKKLLNSWRLIWKTFAQSYQII